MEELHLLSILKAVYGWVISLALLWSPFAQQPGKGSNHVMLWCCDGQCEGQPFPCVAHKLTSCTPYADIHLHFSKNKIMFLAVHCHLRHVCTLKKKKKMCSVCSGKVIPHCYFRCCCSSPFSEARHQRFSQATPVSSPSSSVNDFCQYNKAKINAILTLSNLIAELSLCTKWHTTSCTW